ncbi:MAG: T9SS type A sorting domain-containing protein [Marinilabiliaceae bacterium]|nr:T9SS type A sorting domain-containing protein [Marinilabiliaceae bacterium]
MTLKEYYILICLLLIGQNITLGQSSIPDNTFMSLDGMEWKDYVSSALVNTEKEEYTYNNEGLVTSATLSYWQCLSPTYRYSNRITTNYNNSILDSKIYANYSESTWIDTLMRKFSFNEKNELTTVEIFSRLSNNESWKPETKEIYTYNDKGAINELYFYEWNTETNTWDNVEKNLYEYDNSNTLKTFTSWVWDFLLDEWLYFDKEEYKTEDSWAKYCYFEWNEMNDQWEYVFKDSSIYSTDGLKFSYLSKYWNQALSSWVNFTKELHDLNTDGRILTYTEWEWNNNTQKWDYYDKEIYEYDSYGNITQFIDMDNNDSQFNVWINNLKEVYHYNNLYTAEKLIIPYDEPIINGVYFNTMITLIDAYSWDGSSWQSASLGSFAYSHFTQTNNRDAKTDDYLMIYPIPFSDYLLVKGIENSIIEIFDANGKKCIYEHITSDHHLVLTESLPQGLYLIQVKDSIGKTIVSKAMKK